MCSGLHGHRCDRLHCYCCRMQVLLVSLVCNGLLPSRAQPIAYDTPEYLQAEMNGEGDLSMGRSAVNSDCWASAICCGSAYQHDCSLQG